MIRMILDVATMRVIYYTEDLNEPLTIVEKTLCYDYEGQLPSGMKLSNSWNYRLIGNQLVNTEAAPVTKVTLLESNRREAQKLLNDRINLARAPLMPTNTGGEWVRRLKLEDTEFLTSIALIQGQQPEDLHREILALQSRRQQQLKNTELNRVYYLRELKQATTSERVVELRDEFANADLTVLQIK